MPTYKNNTAATITTTEAFTGNTVHVKAGQQIARDQILLGNELTLVSPAPYYNPVNTYHTITTGALGNQSVSLNQATKKIRIQKVATATITVYLQSDQNTPPILTAWNGDDPIVDILIEGKVDTIVIYFDGAGSCQLVEFSE